MKTYHIALICFCLLIASCTLPPEYIGEKRTPTSSVAVFYSVKDVSRPYKVIGHFVIHKYIKSAVEKSLASNAKKIGADAVLILGPDTGNPNRIDAEALKYE